MTKSRLIVIQEEMERMSRLLGDLLLLARADSGGLPLRHDRVELDNLLFDVYRQMSRHGKAGRPGAGSRRSGDGIR